MPGDDLEALVRAARGLLRTGMTPAAAFASPAVAWPDRRRAALAVCVAAGVPRADAVRRLTAGVERLFAEVAPGDEAVVGELLAGIGFFDVHRPLDEHGERIANLLRAAAKAAGTVPGGPALTISRQLATGNPAGAFLSLVRLGSRRPPREPAAFWARLTEAGEALCRGGAPDEAVAGAVALCRRNARGGDDAPRHP